MTAQSVRFSTRESPRSVNGGRGWDAFRARQWLRLSGFRARVELPTATQLRFRQHEPDSFLPDSFRTQTDALPRGVQVVYAQETPTP